MMNSPCTTSWVTAALQGAGPLPRLISALFSPAQAWIGAKMKEHQLILHSLKCGKKIQGRHVHMQLMEIKPL